MCLHSRHSKKRITVSKRRTTVTHIEVACLICCLILVNTFQETCANIHKQFRVRDSCCLRIEFQLNTYSGYPKNTRLTTIWQPLKNLLFPLDRLGFHWKSWCYTPGIHQIEKLTVLDKNWNEPKVATWICTARFRGIWVSLFGGFWDVAFSVETVTVISGREYSTSRFLGTVWGWDERCGTVSSVLKVINWVLTTVQW